MGLRSSRFSAGFRRVFVMGICVLLIGMNGLPGEAKCDIKAIFNFGDSNSDTGGFVAAFPPQSSPYGMTYFHRPAGRASDGRDAIDFLAQAFGFPFLSPYLQSIGSNFMHGANFATSASTVLLPTTSLFVTGVSPFSLGIQLNQMKEFKAKVLELQSKGLMYGTKACCGNGGGAYNYNPKVFCGNSKVINGTKITATACSDPQNYVSWDGIHATEAANKLVTLSILKGSYFDPPFPISKLCHLHPIV
ncbi:GDSL esterase/lipase At4g01130-like isoform X6 [Tasmannia lanceolata]|uniref:GDSL esterase/lipase At4g01130-like isoform X6 n=1 Tax=Tasmannia lanceolata TaxID=3420 RepID=UPI0040633DC7